MIILQLNDFIIYSLFQAVQLNRAQRGKWRAREEMKNAWKKLITQRFSRSLFVALGRFMFCIQGGNHGTSTVVLFLVNVSQCSQGYPSARVNLLLSNRATTCLVL